MKDKTKKVLKTIGLVVLALFATLGVVLGGLLIGEMGKGNNKPVLMEGERISLRSPVRKAPSLQGADNLFETMGTYVSASGAFNTTADAFYPDPAFGSVYIENLPIGYYYFGGTNVNGLFHCNYFGSPSALDSPFGFLSGAKSGALSTQIAGYSVLSVPYFFFGGGTVVASTDNGNLPFLALVDTLKVPASSRITFGDNWYPLKIFGDNVTSGGSFLIMDEATLEHTYTGGYTTTIAVLFRYQGVVYDRIRFMCTNLNGLGKPYVDESGTVQHPDRPSSNSIFVLESVTFYSSWLTGDDANYLKVLSAQHSDSPSTDRNNNVYYPYLGKTQWLTQSRTIEILDEIDTNVYTSGRWQGYNALQVLQFISSYYSDGSSLAVADGQSALELLTTAFASVAPILGISLFPNITIGLLIFLPLVAGIIVLIIKAVKK